MLEDWVTRYHPPFQDPPKIQRVTGNYYTFNVRTFFHIIIIQSMSFQEIKMSTGGKNQ